MREREPPRGIQLEDVWVKRGKTRRIREIYKDPRGRTWIRYVNGVGAPHWCSRNEWLSWVSAAQFLRNGAEPRKTWNP